MGKLHVKIKNAPEGIHPDQLFTDQAHFDEIMKIWQDTGKMQKVKQTKTGFTFETKLPAFEDSNKGSGTIEEVADDFTNVPEETTDEETNDEDPQ